MDIKKLLVIAAEQKASDLHLVKDLKPILRIDGQLVPIDEALKKNKLSVESGQTAPEYNNNLYVLSEEGEILKGNRHKSDDGSFFPLTKADLEAAVGDVIRPEQRERLEKERDLDFCYSVDGYRFRVNVSYERENLKMVARVISNQSPTLEDVNMPSIIYNLLDMKQGLILLTGPTGCGKSTSLAAMINYLNDKYNYNIVTFEDPIEFMFKSNKSIITQRQLGFDFPSFASGLRHVLRQDPNVIMVGEMRDLETISSAITLAETGHLVLATLHTFNASQTVDRIIDIFPPFQQNQVRSQLSMILAAVISQRLLPKVGGGRVVAREIMIRNSAIANLIREQKIVQIKNVIETSYGDGMISLSRDIKDLYTQGLVSKEVYESQSEEMDLLV
ncbi:type IV pili twitching motility protein PilT [Candidatus Falkowbacteria bacterium CG10_big_fil_rev_8_21_14_0_10_39_9]|uniref:Type IV pili twitching motility protein PilT n=1 Tax=Candidatus Falkowbacteria bacterium CG10_big_fil_rev_8_21_14_0_10_39_9 TaxID=1974566 RepID=A0A2M6WRE3_9BACT|nr:MAG: type IV pili twitching motility protein PilT [Candidatus Falkowbacteria bacterium CG10_big_fil_rev_8_21_14_0_10_39_9]